MGAGDAGRGFCGLNGRTRAMRDEGSAWVQRKLFSGLGEAETRGVLRLPVPLRRSEASGSLRMTWFGGMGREADSSAALLRLTGQQQRQNRSRFLDSASLRDATLEMTQVLGVWVEKQILRLRLRMTVFVVWALWAKDDGKNKQRQNRCRFLDSGMTKAGPSPSPGSGSGFRLRAQTPAKRLNSK